MAYYVDVILPIPVNQKFTYIISKDEYDFIKPGMRIIVPFGKSKLYTSVNYCSFWKIEIIYICFI